VNHALRMEPEKIIVLRYYDPSRRGCKLKLDQISCAGQTFLRRGGHFDVTPPKAGRNVA
jgi:hypothetical protein